MNPYYPPNPLPEWDSVNLRDHHRKRLYENRGCIEKLLGTSAGTLTEEQYRDLSKNIVNHPFMAWGALSESEPMKGDHEHREFAVNTDLAMSILSDDRHKFISSYHLHLPSCVKHSVTRTGTGGLKTRVLSWIRAQENTNRFKGRAKMYDF